MKNLDSYFHKSIVYVFYLLFLTLPLIWYPTLSELFEFPKMVYVYVFTVVIVGLWISRMVVTGKMIFSKTIFDLPIGFFVTSQFLSTIFSIHKHTSIYGYYSRFHGGLLSSLCYILLYYAFVSNFSKNLSYRAVGFIVAGAVMASLYALPEHYGYSPSCVVVSGELNVDCWVQDVQTRIYGTFGQPNWLAAYIVVVSPLIWFLVSLSKKRFSTNMAVLLGVQVLLFAVLLFTRSKSGLIGFGFAFVCFLLLSVFKSLKDLRNNEVFVAVFVAMSLYIGTEYTPNFMDLSKRFVRSQSEVVSVNTDNSVGTVLENGGTNSGEIRRIVWSGAFDIFKSNPVLGTGLETFAYSYYKFRPMEHNNVSEWDFLYNKAHNEFLNIAANSGLVGIATYLLFMAYYVVWTVVYTYKHKGSVDLLPIALLCGFLGLSVSNFFGFSTVAVSVLFYLYPAIFLVYTEQVAGYLPVLAIDPSALSKKQRKQIKKNEIDQGSGSITYFSLFVVLVIVLFFVNRNFNYLNADLVYAKAGKMESAGRLNESLSLYQQAIKLSPNEPVFHNDFADALSKAVLTEAQAGNESAAISLAQKAFDESTTTLKLNPNHLNYYKTQAGVYIRIGSLDVKLLDGARNIITKAQELAPTDAKLTYNLSLVNLDQGNTEESVRLLEKTLLMKPNYEAARMQLADLYVQIEKYDLARVQYEYILEFIAPANTKAQEALQSISEK